MSYTISFGCESAAAVIPDRQLHGGKGAGLIEMANLGVPVPPGLVISTDVCRYFFAHQQKFPTRLRNDVNAGLAAVEQATGRRFGDSKRPLLLSVRSGSPVSMPGMMDTILNLGLTEATIAGVIAQSGDPRFGWDSYRRLLQMYGSVVLDVAHTEFEKILADRKQRCGVPLDTDLSADDLQHVAREYLALIARVTGRPFPQDPREQLWGAIGAVFRSWQNRRAVDYRRINNLQHVSGTACVVQAMVFGNLGAQSATGVAFTRDPSTGANYFFGEYLPNAQGEDVVAGIRTPLPLNRQSAAAHERDPATSLEVCFPQCYAALVRLKHQLERHFADVQDIEFTIESGRVWVLQTRAAQRSALAAIRIATDLVDENICSATVALTKIKPAHVEQLLHPNIDAAAKTAAIAAGKLLAKGLPASPGGAVGRVVFTADHAVEWVERGEPVILVRAETSPDDIHGMHVAQGLLTARGGLTSHAAVVARGMGTPCVVGCETMVIDDTSRTCTAPSGLIVREGEWLSIDGATGDVLTGALPLVQVDVQTTLGTILQWADAQRTLTVRANADTAEDARLALAQGAEGIGLARTEHMFFAPDRIPLVREMIVAPDVATRRKALAQLLPLQRQDCTDLLRVMAGRPVTIRLLDPPLHEFLPHTTEEIAGLADALGLVPAALNRHIDTLREQNPMLGHRGCRLGLSYPEIYRMQVRAMLEALCGLTQQGIPVGQLEIEVPLVMHANEMARVRDLIVETVDAVFHETGVTVSYALGAMLELPRACLIAGELAKLVDFLSFGTNDLTQTTLGISRDDAARFLGRYLRDGVLTADPFATLDQVGVGGLMRLAVEQARAVKPDLPIGICGEHGGDPASIAFCRSLGLSYVSCSPFRLSVARLAAAQAEEAYISLTPCKRLGRARA